MYVAKIKELISCAVTLFSHMQIVFIIAKINLIIYLL